MPPSIRPPRRLSPASLERAALHRLQRASLSEQQLRDALQRKLRRVEAVHGSEPRAAEWIDALVDKLTRLGFLDDVRVAQARAQALRARGASRRLVAQKLRRHGLDAEGALQQVDLEAGAGTDGAPRGGDPAELAAARAYVKRRRLHGRERSKALAALARQGFRFEIARRALDVPEG